MFASCTHFVLASEIFLFSYYRAFVLASCTDTPICVSFLSIWIEKKLLYSKLRNIPVNEKAKTTIEKPSADKIDASTMTEDLGVNIRIFSSSSSS